MNYLFLYLNMLYCAFVIVSFTLLDYFLSHDVTLSLLCKYLGFLLIFCFSRTMDQCSKRQTIQSVFVVHQIFIFNPIYLIQFFVLFHYCLSNSISFYFIWFGFNLITLQFFFQFVLTSLLQPMQHVYFSLEVFYKNKLRHFTQYPSFHSTLWILFALLIRASLYNSCQLQIQVIINKIPQKFHN